MIKNVLIAWAGILVGVLLGYLLVFKTGLFVKPMPITNQKPPANVQKQIVGFLPFWLIDKADSDYSKYITQLNYFDLTIDSDGTILKSNDAGELDPGWFALKSDKAGNYLSAAKAKGLTLSLTAFSSDEKAINSILSDPVKNAQNFSNDFIPVMKQYGFSDLNLDIEQVNDATSGARTRFANFVGEIKRNLSLQNAGTLTVDVSPIAFVKNTNLVDPNAISGYADYIILMAYDFHNPGSFVTGPVSPESGAGIVSEFDTESAVEAALSTVPPQKLLLGIPLYGYEWESLTDVPRSAVIPSTSIIISNLRAEDFLSKCASCSASFDKTDQEENIIYKDAQTGTFHQIFYPVAASTGAKVTFAKSKNLGGMALWALGYEGPTILQPLAGFYR